MVVRVVVAPDGSPVEVYAALPAEPDLTTVISLIRDKHTVLDLGAGAGRIAEPLAQAGHAVVAVDESAEMLAHLRHARTVHATIEGFDADSRFDAVLLLSHIINTPDETQRRAALDAVARHLSPEGVAVVQRHDPARRLHPDCTWLGSVQVALTDLDDSQWPTVHATTRYQLGAQVWDQPWTAVVLDDAATTSALQLSGLRPVRMDGPWVQAVLDRGSAAV
jgi:SAM-dependent methyltransferase